MVALLSLSSSLLSLHTGHVDGRLAFEGSQGLLAGGNRPEKLLEQEFLWFGWTWSSSWCLVAKHAPCTGPHDSMLDVPLLCDQLPSAEKC